jgi:hypothetical protein
MMQVVGAVLVRPTLWGTALRQWLRLTPRRWWTAAPFLPLPNREYMKMRNTIQYGNEQHPMVAHDVVSYLQWCREWKHLS